MVTRVGICRRKAQLLVAWSSLLVVLVLCWGCGAESSYQDWEEQGGNGYGLVHDEPIIGYKLAKLSPPPPPLQLGPVPVKPGPTPLEVIDVLFVYTENALAAASEPDVPNLDYMKRFIAEKVRQTNKVYEKLGFKFRVVHTELFDFGSYGEEDDFLQWDHGRNELYGFVESSASGLWNKREQYGADLVGFLYERTPEHARRGWGCGAARNTFFLIPRVCDVSSFGCVENSTVDYQIAHEIGHSLGLEDNTLALIDHKMKTRTIMADPDRGTPESCYERIGKFSPKKGGNEEIIKEVAKSWDSHYFNWNSNVECELLDNFHWIGDGYCDSGAEDVTITYTDDRGDPVTTTVIIEYNSDLCDWDGGDCCPGTCVDATYACGSTSYECIDPTQGFIPT